MTETPPLLLVNDLRKGFSLIGKGRCDVDKILFLGVGGFWLIDLTG